MKQRVLSQFCLARQNIKARYRGKQLSLELDRYITDKFNQGGYTKEKNKSNRIFLIYINTNYSKISVSKYINSPSHRLAVKNDPVFEKYDIVLSSWDKDLRVPTRGIDLGLRLERIKQKMHLLVQ